MKQIPCSHKDCGERRVHHERSDVMRSHRMLKVDNDHPDDSPMYCSLECAMLDGAFNVKTGWQINKRKSKSS